MKNKILTLGTIIAFLAGSTLLTSCGSGTQKDADSTEQQDEAIMASTHVCPMHPEITGLEGDTCSKCGMDLVASADTEGDMNVIATHVCPMHPEITGLEGDKCSKCGMDLVADTGDLEDQH